MNKSYNFNSLEFNLYQLLDIPLTATCQEASKSFRKIVKKFHPDKITKLEEKIYENIITANHILSDPILKNQYDNWLLKSNQQHNQLKDNFKNSKQNVNKYFPSNKKEAANSFVEQSRMLLNRHGNMNYSRDVKTNLSNHESKRRELKNIQRDFNLNEENFNTVFEDRKVNGLYSDKIIRYEQDKIVPYQCSKNKVNYVHLEDCKKLYLEDSVQTDNYTSLDRAFKLYQTGKVTKNKTNNRDNNDFQYDNMDIEIDRLNLDELNI
jgi:curved DNA-binding protein CbpA